MKRSSASGRYENSGKISGVGVRPVGDPPTYFEKKDGVLQKHASPRPVSNLVPTNTPVNSKPAKS